MKDTPNEIIEEESFNKKIWLEASTLNMLPGEIVTFTVKDKETEETIIEQATVNGDGKAFVLLDSSYTTEQEERQVITPIKEADYFRKGWWSIDEAGEKSITRAVPGMSVYFHVETTVPDGKQVHIELYENDNNEKEETGTGDKDDHIGLVSSATKKPSTHETVSNGKIVKFISLNNLQDYIDNEVDKQIELYFRCSYDGENVELPQSSGDYLIVGTLVIDRYKMPGLNGNGTDIADDLTYGTGSPQNNPIYNKGQVPQFKIEYANNGFDEQRHALFTNKANLPAVEPVLKESMEEPKEDLAEAEPNRFSTLIEETTVKRDNTYVATPRPEDISLRAKAAAQKATKNLKAKYSRKEIEGLGYLMSYRTVKVPERSLWADFKLMEESMVWGELNTVLDQMIAKFKSNTGGIFENTLLTKSIKNNPSTQRYCMYMENYIAEKIKQETLKNIWSVEDKKLDFEEKDYVNSERRRKDKIKGNDIIDDKSKLTVPFTRPSFSYKNNNNLLEGRTLALNDIWATEVILKELKNKGENYTAKYQVILWDHFGLDIPDMQKFFYYGAGFRAWFVLQHLYGYKPFVTKMTFEKEFKGNINEGREERRAKQKAKENELTPAQQRVWDKAINPFPTGPKW